MVMGSPAARRRVVRSRARSRRARDAGAEHVALAVGASGSLDAGVNEAAAATAPAAKAIQKKRESLLTAAPSFNGADTGRVDETPQRSNFLGHFGDQDHWVYRSLSHQASRGGRLQAASFSGQYTHGVLIRRY